MKTLTIEIIFKSSTLIGSGEGLGAVIDTDVVFDEFGFPYIPAKRVKGCLKDAANQLKDMFDLSGIKFPLKIDEAFGKEGQQESSPVYFSNLTMKDYEKNKEWIEYLSGKYKNVISSDSVINYFTELRQQTSIDEKTGVAKKHSLRTTRVIKEGHKFYGEIDIKDYEVIDTLLLSCVNFKNMGTKRTRGFGQIECNLYDGNVRLTDKGRVDKLCRN